MDERPIGVFDSGNGGISALREMVRLLPNERFVYYGDNKNAPYGSRPEQEIRELVKADVDFLLQKNVKAIVIACNTATSAAAEMLRATLSLPIIGMEPALKPASLLRKNGIVGVMATEATLRQKKFQLLMEKYGQNAVRIPCKGLVEFVERGELSGERLEEFLREKLRPFQNVTIDSAVLGCTHYVFVKKAFEKVLPNTVFVDGNEGTARQLKRVLQEKNLLSGAEKGGVELFSSADDASVISLMSYLLAIDM